MKIILNTRGTGEDITPQLQAFMEYVNSGILSSNPLVQAIDQRVNEVKQNEEARLSYMTLELKLRDAHKEGVAEGRAEGKAEGKFENLLENVKSLMKSIPCDAKRAMDLLNVPEATRGKILVQL
ncbi:hypothetical protein [uncultured Selenomonas sp.]|uniref:hypothetical protein n=1 Tax=uncultured Selenomonas sp. TaxID=159275 RepID=UPI0025E36CDF|nr:hypothetical protein [uncultured Selenomonas sp.]